MNLPPVAETIEQVRAAVANARCDGKTIGFVPTMGALHAGHASLIRESRIQNGFTVVSIFVNPSQFGPNEDLSRYPRTFGVDRELCGAVGVDLIFAPAKEEMYPEAYCTWVTVEKLADSLCGASRPGHFRGVATIVLKLFNIVQPDTAYFGQKDAQQARILQKMVEDLNLPLHIHVLPTVREPDGLAMSSRNRYLDPAQRKHATVLFRALEKVMQLVAGGERDAARIESVLVEEVTSTPGARLDYARVVDALSLSPISTIDRPALAAMAVFFGSTRLIDNATLTP